MEKKYFTYTQKQNDIQTLRFVDNGVTGCDVKWFDTHVVAVSGTSEQVAALVALQPAEISFTEISFDAFFTLAVKSTQAQFALKNLDAQCKAELDNLAGFYPKAEMDSWVKQEQEARAFVKSSAAVTPLLDALLISRAQNETKAELANKIIAAADAYAVKVGEIVGKYQGLRKAVFA